MNRPTDVNSYTAPGCHEKYVAWQVRERCGLYDLCDSGGLGPGLLAGSERARKSINGHGQGALLVDLESRGRPPAAGKVSGDGDWFDIGTGLEKPSQPLVVRPARQDRCLEPVVMVSPLDNAARTLPRKLYATSGSATRAKRDALDKVPPAVLFCPQRYCRRCGRLSTYTSCDEAVSVCAEKRGRDARRVMGCRRKGVQSAPKISPAPVSRAELRPPTANRRPCEHVLC